MELKTFEDEENVSINIFCTMLIRKIKFVLKYLNAYD